MPHFACTPSLKHTPWHQKEAAPAVPSPTPLSWPTSLTPCNLHTPLLLLQVKLCYDMFALSGLMDHFGLSMRTLSSFISAVSSHYHSIPYHNFNHVVHVTHGVWMVGGVLVSLGWPLGLLGGLRCQSLMVTGTHMGAAFMGACVDADAWMALVAAVVGAGVRRGQVIACRLGGRADLCRAVLPTVL